MEYQATHIGKSEVLDFYDRKAKTPYFSVYVKSQKVDEYNGEDMDEAREQLEDLITRYEKRNFTRVLTLKLHPDKEKTYTSKSPYSAQIYFLCAETGLLPTQQNTDVNAILLNEINNLKAEINALKLKEVNEEEQDEEEEEEDRSMALINGVNNIIEHPLISGLINKWINGGQRVNNLAGTETQSAEEYVQVLFSKGVTLEHLRKLSEMPESKIKMLLTML